MPGTGPTPLSYCQIGVGRGNLTAMSLDTQPRGDGGKFGEKPDVGIARRMSDLLRQGLGHDGTDTPRPALDDLDGRLAAQQAELDAELSVEVASAVPVEATVEVDDAARLSAQLANLDALDAQPSEVRGETGPEVAVPADAGQLVGAGKSLDEDLDRQLAVLAALEAKDSPVEDDVETPESDLLFPVDDDEVEAKIRRWDPDQHPRDHRGRFATIGSTVSLPDSAGGGEGRVLAATGGGNIRVRKADGTEVDVAAKETEVTRSAAANAAERSFNNRAGAETFGGFGDDAQPTRAPAAGNPHPEPKPSQAHLDELDRMQRENPRARFLGVAKLTDGGPVGTAVEVDTPDGVATVTRTGADQWQVSREGQPTRTAALGGRMQVIGEPRPVTAKPDAAAHADGSRVTLPDGSVGTVVGTGPKGVGVRGGDGKLTVHPATDLTAAGDVPNEGPTNVSALKAGDYVSFLDSDGDDINGTVDDVQIDGRQAVITVNGSPHKLLSDSIVNVAGEAPGYDDVDWDTHPTDMSDEQLAAEIAKVMDTQTDDEDQSQDLDAHLEELSAEQQSRGAKPPNGGPGGPFLVNTPDSTPEQRAVWAIAEALDDPIESLQDAATNKRQRREAETLQEAQTALEQEGSLTQSERVELADELDRIAEDSLNGDEGDPRVQKIRAAATALRGDSAPGTAEGDLPEPSGPGSEIAADSAVDDTGWVGGKAPNGADGTGTRPDGSAWGSGYQDGDPRQDPAYDQYTTELDAHLEATLKEIGDTESIYDKVNGVPGAYRPERQAQHDALLDELMAGFAGVPQENRAIVMAGPPGAGKSSVIKAAGDKFGVVADGDGNPTNYAIVNPDDMKELIVAKGLIPADYPGRGIGPGESATFMHEESSHLAARLLTRLKAAGHNVILDGTFSGNPDKQSGKVTQLRADGYTVTGVLVDGAVERSLTNAAKRHRKAGTEPGGSYEGRYVPYPLIESNRPSGDATSAVFGRPHRNKASENIEAVQDAFDGGVMWFDNSNYDALLVHQVGPGQTTTSGNTEKAAEHGEVKAAGGADRNRGNAEQLRRYWTHGAGAAKIGWGTAGDFDRCVTAVSEHMDPERAKGYCNLRHQDAVGSPPGKGHKALLEMGLGPMLPGLEVKADPPATDPAANAAGAVNENPAPAGVMVALYPPDDIAQALALDAEGAEPMTTLHMTLAYLGKVDDVGVEQVGALVELVREFAAQSYDVAAEVAGLGRWGAGEDGDAFVALIDAPELPDFRADLVDALTAAGFAPRTDHGFTPHITLAYLPPDAETPLERLETLPATFGFLSVAVGPDVWDFPLAADDTESVDDDTESV